MKAKLDYLEYVALPWYTQIGYKIWRFLYFIVFALVDLVVGLAKQVWSFIKKIGVSIKKMYISLRFGDWATKLSFLFVGTGYIKRGQIVKGILYLIAEVAFILFMILFGGKYFTKFFTLGSIASAFTCEDVEGYWATKAEAEQDIVKKINYIQDTYSRLAIEIQEIDNAQSDYTKASTEKVIYLNNNDKTLKGKLETIFLAAARAINGDRASGVSMDVVKAMNNSIYLYQQGYIDEYSLTRPIKRNPKYDSEPMGIDDFEHESNEGLMQSLLTIADQYSDEKIMEFMDKAFQGNKEIDIKSIPIKDVEDFIMIILGSVKADSRYSFYELKRSDPMEQILKEEKYSMPNYGYARKEK